MDLIVRVIGDWVVTMSDGKIVRITSQWGISPRSIFDWNEPVLYREGRHEIEVQIDSFDFNRKDGAVVKIFFTDPGSSRESIFVNPKDLRS